MLENLQVVVNASILKVKDAIVDNYLEAFQHRAVKG